MRFLFTLFLLSAFIFSCGNGEFDKLRYIKLNYGKKERFVVFTRSQTQTHKDVEKIINENGGEIHKRLKYSKGFVAYFRPQTVSSLNLDPKIVIQRDYIHKIDQGCQEKPDPQDPPPDSQPVQSLPWGIIRVNANKAWQFTKGDGVVVCVVDTGVDIDHSDLKNNILGGENFIQGVDSYDDDNGHGTHVSGTIAAIDNNIGVVGVAPNAKIWASKVLDFSGRGYSSDISDGLYSCVANGAHVINMSLGSSQPSEIIHDAIKYAKNNGLIIVAAAGNDGRGNVGYPAAFPEAVAISASDSLDQRAWFSNYGSEIEFIAPGQSVLSTVPNDNYDSYDGTSMATPHVAGVYALILSLNRSEIVTDKLNIPYNEQGKGLPNAWASLW
jgi:subtilisin